MAKITDKIAALPPGESFHSLEFFPPKTEMVCAFGDHSVTTTIQCLH